MDQKKVPGSIAEAVLLHARKNPRRMAMGDASVAYTYAETAEAAGHGAAALKKWSVAPGDRVLAECTQNTEFLILDLACALAGAVFVPVEKKASPERVEEIFRETGAVCMITQTEYPGYACRHSYADFTDTRKVMDAPISGLEEGGGADPVPGAPASTAEILFTTGTTGKPKGIVLSHRANIAVAENIMYGTEMGPDTVELVPLPLSHSHGLRTCYANLLNGSGVVIADGVMNVSLLFRMIKKYGVNALDFSPALLKVLLKIARKGLLEYQDVVDYIEIGTAFLDDEIKEELKKIFPKSRLYNFYGSTEAGRTCVLDFNKEDFSGCIGYPARNAEFLLVDEARRPVDNSKDRPGLIAVRGAMMMDGYFKSPELTRQTVEDGILYTSDLGYKDEKGRIYMVGRQGEVINYKGIKISPEEIESVAVKYPGITDCACIPARDKLRGEVPKLFIQLKAPGDYREEDYRVWLKERLGTARMPVYIEIAEKIPRSANGKLQRKKLMEAAPQDS